MAGSHGGRRPGAGRPKGALAPETADIKAMIVGALQSVGGVKYFAARALDQPVAFMALVGRVLPMQVTGENGGALVVDIHWADATPKLNGHTHDPLTIEADEAMIVSFETKDGTT